MRDFAGGSNAPSKTRGQLRDARCPRPQQPLPDTGRDGAGALIVGLSGKGLGWLALAVIGVSLIALAEFWIS